MGLYVGEKKRLEAVERADFIELGHSMGLSRRAAETRIDVLRDCVVAALERKPPTAPIVKSCGQSRTSRKSASRSWPWYKGNASALVKLCRHVVRLSSSVSLVPGQCTRLLQLACAVHAPDMREHLARAYAVVIGGLFNDRSLTCNAVDRCQTCSIRAIGQVFVRGRCATVRFLRKCQHRLSIRLSRDQHSVAFQQLYRDSSWAFLFYLN